jgi:ATP-dependent helicase/nuclease subunit A
MTVISPGEQASELQEQASKPDASVFVPANAGAGKTHVLVARVIRLLLSGVQPERILCLTYTRAAAAEMSDRLFDKLSKWIALDDNRLIDQIHKDAGKFRRDELELAQARRLFTRALETPGRLKVQTIHAFCERLLQRFPIEAGVVPGFHVLSEPDSRDLMALARAQVLTRDDDKIREAVSVFVRFANEQQFAGLLDELKNRSSKLLHKYGSANEFGTLHDNLNQLFGLNDDETPQSIAGTFKKAISHLDLVRARVTLAQSDKQTDTRQLAHLEKLLAANDPETKLASARKLSFKTDGDPKQDASLITKDIAEANPGVRETLCELRDISALLDPRFKAATIINSTHALTFAGLEILKTFNAMKRDLAGYDFADLIDQTVELLRDKPDAAWVLYKLDGGLDHILIDEAQDTSPEQWQIINALTEEFFSGEGARPDIARTVFAVGDRKQSIYSFQGADPEKFDDQATYYQRRIGEAGATYREVSLEHSFRSSELILKAVDKVFKRDDARRGVVSALQPEVTHKTTRPGEKGLVEIWDLVCGQPGEDTSHWEPKSATYEDPPHLAMARRIADTIRGWLYDAPVELLAHDRPVQASDILILVRRRSYLMAAIVRALKEANVPVAGADRLKLLDHIAVQDLMALAQTCILPQDDLSLAGLLKSQLFTHDDSHTRFTEDDLFALAHERKSTSLWQRLKQAADQGKPYRQTIEKLERWRDLASRERVYEFYSTVLSRDGGRRAMLAGLGPEAADPIDAFVQLSMDYEQQHTGTLAGFLAWLEATQADIKRDMDQSGGEVRVMTVHGAKGLEAPIVFLPDTCSVPDSQKTGKIQFAGDVPVWTLKSDYSTSQTRQLQEQAYQQALEEHNRLLYVAMTRARYRLYVCGFVKSEDAKLADNFWYSMIGCALTGNENPLLQETHDDGFKLWRAGEPQVPEVKSGSGETPSQACKPPDWTAQMAPAIARPHRWLVPSKIEAAGEADDGWSNEIALSPLKPRNDTRFRRGTLVHRLLQTLPDLPPDQREAAARRYLTANAATQVEATVEEVMQLFADPEFAAVFSAAGRAEVSIAAMIDTPNGERFGLTGQIDRLLVEPARVLVVDFKTNRPPPSEVAQVPDIYLRQLAAYKRALGPIYPEKRIECALLWTDAPRLMPIPDHMLEEAWAKAAITTV